MESSNSYSVSLQRAAPRTIAAVRARLAPSRVSAEFKRYLDRVYAARASGMQLDGQNVFIYRDAEDEPGQLDVDFGVGITAPITPVGDVRPVELPVGEVATTTHRGAYTELGAAHAAVVNWCRAHSRVLAGPRWEVYGHWTESELPRTDIYYLLRPTLEAS
jgi:effector-binding domain-containing protein